MYTKVVLSVVQIILSVILIIFVLMQSGKSAGLSGSIAGGAETFFGKNKGRTIDAILDKLTTIVAIVFGGVSIWLFYLTNFK